MANTRLEPGSEPLTDRPVCDEWGFYDPEQAGLEALVRLLEPHENDDDDPDHTMASPLPLDDDTSTR